MVSIINVTPKGRPKYGMNVYELRINRTLISTFEHNRQPGALVRCLRDAANAAEAEEAKAQGELLMALFDREV